MIFGDALSCMTCNPLRLMTRTVSRHILNGTRPQPSSSSSSIWTLQHLRMCGDNYMFGHFAFSPALIHAIFTGISRWSVLSCTRFSRLLPKLC